MENLNNGKPVDFNQIQDYEQAARDFAEGNKELEQLLSNCFSKGIKTTACCAGHNDEKRRKPYISFQYSKENEQYIYAIISKLKDRGYNFRYNKLSDNKSFFSIEEGFSFDFGYSSTMFSEINNIINTFDKEKDYFVELPKDLQKFGLIVKTSEHDELLITDGTSNYFQMCYEKTPNGYEYSMFASDPYYNSLAEKQNFTKISLMGAFPSYSLRVPEREMAIHGLNEIASNIQTFEDKSASLPVSTKNELIVENKPKLEIGFEYDERTRSNPLINHLKVELGESLEVVAEKLKTCRDKGINAFTIFNGVELNNYSITDSQQVIEQYNLQVGIESQDDTIIEQQISSKSEVKTNQQIITPPEQDLIVKDTSLEHFMQMRDIQRNQDQLLRQQQLGQLPQQEIQQNPQQVGGTGR